MPWNAMEHSMNDMTEHTPTPWFVMHGTDIMHGDKATRHASVDKLWADGGTQACANAAFIVRACNAHDELVAALTALCCTARTFRNVPKDEKEWTPLDDEALDAAFAALAKVQS